MWFKRGIFAKQMLRSAQTLPMQQQSNFNYGRLMAGGVAAAAATWYMYNQEKPKMPAMPFFQAAIPAACQGAYTLPTAEEVARARKDLHEFIDDQIFMGPLLVRLSWHDAGTYEMTGNTGGPRATMRFEGGEAAHDANAGLQIAVNLLAPLKKKHPSFSNADFWSLAAVVAIKEMGGPTVHWRAGRPDSSSAKESVPDGRLPDATQGCPHLRSVFNRMGFNDQEIVALSGAHALGMCHGDRSGFIGAWTVTPLACDNAFFINLVDMKWHLTKQENGLPVWKTKDQGGIIMLPTDMALLEDEKMVCWVELYAKDKARWEADFAAAFAKLQELGVSAFHKGSPYKL